VRVPARRGAPAPETSCPPATTEHPGPDAGSNRASSSRGLTWPERKRSPVRPGPWRFSGGTLVRAWSMCWPQPVQVILVQRLQTAGLHMGRSSPRGTRRARLAGPGRRIPPAGQASPPGRSSQRKCSQSPCSCSRRHSTAAGEIWLACMSAAVRCAARSTRTHRSM